MEYFWYTSDNIPKGLGFSHFDAFHLCWLGAMAAVILVSCFGYHRLGEKGRAYWRSAVAMLLIADELFKLIPMLVLGTFRVDYLPFQLCSINIFIIAYHAWRPNATVGNFLYTVCIPGALAAMLFPTWTKLNGLNFMSIHSFTVHILLILYPVVLTVNGDIKPDIRLMPRSLGLLVCFAALALTLNLFWDTNFMFLMSASKGNPLYWFKQHWGSHLYGFPVIISVVIAVLYGPLELYKLSKSHHNRNPKIA